LWQWQDSRKEGAVLKASAAAAGALTPAHRRTDAATQTQATQTTDAAIANLKEQLAAAVRAGEGYSEELAEARVQAEEAVGLVEALEAQLEAVKAQVNPAQGGLGYMSEFFAQSQACNSFADKLICSVDNTAYKIHMIAPTLCG